MKSEYLSVWYDEPLMVLYIRNHIYSLGIVFHDTIVDLYDGTPAKLNTIFKAARVRGIDPDWAIVERAWPVRKWGQKFQGGIYNELFQVDK